MKVSDNALNVLAAMAYRGIGKAWVVKNIKGGEAATRICTLLNESGKGAGLISLAEFDSVRERVRNAVSISSGAADGVVGIGDSDFPAVRGAVKNSEQPVVLFYRGDLRLLRKDNRNIAVIGLLNPDRDTEVEEADVVERLVGHGATIVSGLAMGCDTIAHKGALRKGGKTIAILPGPLHDIIPSSNRGLADEIVKTGGLLVTEYYESAGSKMELSGRYQERDRLQALFSDCVILAASYAKNDLGNDSGARLAMEYARSYSIPRSVVYDSALHAANKKYDLNRQLSAANDGVTVINRTNLDFMAREIVRHQTHAPRETKVQTDLFG